MLSRRELLASTVGVTAGIAAGFRPEAASAAASQAGAGGVASSPARILPSGIVAELVDVCQLPKTYRGTKVANINQTYHDYKNPDLVYVVDGTGKIYRMTLADGSLHLFFDLAAARAGVFQNAYLFDGLRSMALHPNFHRAKNAGYNTLYTVHTETLSSRTPAGSTLFTGPFTAACYKCVVTEWQVYAQDRSRVNPGSGRELFRSTVWSKEHPIDQVIFNPNLTSSDPAYWNMYVGVGDGGNSIPRQSDPVFNLPQDPTHIHGKILCINPLPKSGKAYGIPPSNPFASRPGWNKMFWALGLRHPQVICFDPGGRKDMFIGNIGQTRVESVYRGARGANFGWPYREGRYVTDRNSTKIIYNLPPAEQDAANGYTYPCAQYGHEDGLAFAGGYVYRGDKLPALHGHYIGGDISSGRIFHFSVDDWSPGTTVPMQELMLRRDGSPITLRQFVGGRVDLQFGQTLDGDVLVSSKLAGRIWQLRLPT